MPEVRPLQATTDGASPGGATHSLRFRAEFGIGVFGPSDVNRYLKEQISSNGIILQRGVSDMVLLLSVDVSGAYFPVPTFGIRPNVVYLFAPKEFAIDGDIHVYWLHSLAPGVAFDFVLDRGPLARFFASPGVSYQLGWFEGYSARGVGLELTLGAELSFGRARNKGLSLALVARRADLNVSSSPTVPADSSRINTLDFSSVMFRVGFQLGA